MNNRVFIDSSILVEYLKDSKTELLDTLLNTDDVDVFLNETVVSEFLLYFLIINGGASPRSLKEAKRIPALFDTNPEFDIIKRFSFLSNNDNLFTLVPSFMAKYNLLPNDAIILATCKLHGITQLASHDTDFIIPCQEEGIEILTES